ncbi:DUF4091 domain-containing protein [Paenibacillus montanisoli]|uniref:Glycoside hydrolase 123 catalytic domain-containing protein n=1 Tax=Paenibacillus montanisoli TaxID=2081970 RepID=A0A328TZW2_9BACL|nr:DUF4091 domain-containing protein [Paenibacillus montanisoli]RAP75979.1 hypothetical protein DL346_11170 [Paenibacillus montanisoli]
MELSVWAVNDGEKVLKEDLANPNKTGNSVWDGRTIRLFGARNETIAFQVIVENGDEEASSLSVEMSGLVHAEHEESRIENDAALDPDPTNYVGRRIEVFTQHYLYVSPDLGTAPQWFYAESAPPLHRSGWIPDGLIPANARPRLGGQPVRVSARSNQGFWIDIYIPREEALKPGMYSGSVTVRCGDAVVAKLPVSLQLYDFALPDENHSVTFVYASDVSDYYPDTPDIRDRFRRMAHRHRFDLVGSDVHMKPFDAELLARYAPYLDGSFFSKENGYEGPGEQVGEGVFPIGMYGASVLGREQEAMQREVDKWVRYFEELNWPGVYFNYLIDEPLPAKYEWIREQAGIIHGSPGAGNRLPLFTTRRYTPEIEDAIDIWCAHKIDPESMARSQETGEKLWFYNGYRPYHGSLILEAEAVDMRVNSWLRYRYRIEGYFVWHGTHWRHNHQGPRGRWHQNVYSYAVTFMYVAKDEAAYYGEDGVHFGNGDGILFYPGREPFFREQDRGIDGPISSIRMKNLRRGIQDYEYLWLAAQRGHQAAADAIAREAVPIGMHETVAGGQASWSSCGSKWDDYRRQAAELIASSAIDVTAN